MPIKRGVLLQETETEVQNKVLDNNTDRIGIWKCWVLGGGENQSTFEDGGIRLL